MSATWPTHREGATSMPLSWDEILARTPWPIAASLDGKTFAFVSRSYAELHGYAPEELVGTPISLILAESVRGEMPRMRSELEASAHHRFETVHRHKTGREIPVLVDATSFPIPGAAAPLAVVHVQDLTEQRRVEAERARYEARYRFILHTVRLPVTLCDVQGNILDMSDHGIRAIGKTRDRIVGRSLTEIFPPPIGGALAARHREVIRSGETRVFEDHLPVAGGRRWFLSVISPVSDVGGGEAGVQIVSHDVTDTKAASESAAMLGRILDSAAEEIFLADPVTLRILFANRTALAHLGYTFEELTRLAARDVVSGPPGEALHAAVAPLTDGSRSVTVSGRQRRKDGTEYPFTARVQMVTHEGRPVLLVLVFDETERDRAQAALAASEARYRRLAETSRDIVFRFDLHHRRFAYVSQAATSILGVAVDAVLADSSAIVAALGPTWRRFIAAAIEDPSRPPIAIELPFPRADGSEVWLNVRSVVVRDETGHAVALEGAATDVTERHQAEETTRALARTLEARVAERTAELERSNRELEAFSYSVSHDLRTPLRSIGGFAGIVLEEDGAALGPESRDALERIGRAVARMSALIDDLLRLSRLGRQELRVSRCDLGAIASRLIAEMGAGRSVVATVAPELFAEADRALVGVLLRNLIENALKFSRSRAEARIDVGAEVQDGERVFFVRDNGIGFDPRYAQKIFEVFQRLHDTSAYEGTGIGLALVARIAARHGGRAWATGEPDRGATFYFTLGRGGSCG